MTRQWASGPWDSRRLRLSLVRSLGGWGHPRLSVPLPVRVGPHDAKTSTACLPPPPTRIGAFSGKGARVPRPWTRGVCCQLAHSASHPRTRTVVIASGAVPEYRRHQWHPTRRTGVGISKHPPAGILAFEAIAFGLDLSARRMSAGAFGLARATEERVSALAQQPQPDCWEPQAVSHRHTRY